MISMSNLRINHVKSERNVSNPRCEYMDNNEIKCLMSAFPTHLLHIPRKSVAFRVL